MREEGVTHICHAVSEAALFRSARGHLQEGVVLTQLGNKVRIVHVLREGSRHGWEGCQADAPLCQVGGRAVRQ
jgi:hypothetical protein